VLKKWVLQLQYIAHVHICTVTSAKKDLLIFIETLHNGPYFVLLCWMRVALETCYIKVVEYRLQQWRSA